MERTIIPSEFKGGIWHSFFSTPSKKDETLVSIFDEKMRYYKLYYPFLEKKQIVGKVFEELGIPHICGELNRKELYKLFIKERKNLCKLKEKYKKYPSLFIENKSRNKGMVKKPMIQTTKQIKVNSVHTNIEKSNEDRDFDNLLSNVYPKGKEGMIQNMNLKQPKSVRFNDGIEVHSVSPSQPLYKLKPLGRLFDEPSAVRSVQTISHTEQELQEKIEDGDSDFDADTGITSDGEDYELEEPPHTEDSNEKSKITLNEKEEENGILNNETKTIYDCNEEDSQSTDHEISKEGNDLILSSKMMTVVQGKWVRETKQIIENIYHINDATSSKRKSMNEEGGNETPEFTLVRSIEQILESIKSLCISNVEEHNTSSENISLRERGESEPNIDIEKGQLLVGNIKVGHDRTDIEISIQDKNELKQRQKDKISLEQDISRFVIDEKLLTIDNNKLSYEDDIFEMKHDMERNLEKRIRTNPTKLVDDLIDYIHDWSSSNEGSSNHNACRTSSTKLILQPEKQDKYKKRKVIKKMKSMVNDESSSEHSLFEEKRCSDKEKNKLGYLSLEEESHSEKEDDLKDLSHEEKCCLDEQSSQVLTVSDDQKVSSKQFESNKLHNTMSQSPVIKAEPLSSSDKLRSKKVAHDLLPNINLPSSKVTEVSEEKELQIDDTFTYIRSMVCNQSTSNPNELYSFCSLITKPILIQPPFEELKDDDRSNYNKSLETEELKQEKKNIKSEYLVSEHSPNSEYGMDTKTYGITKGDNPINDNRNMSPSDENAKYSSKFIVQPKLMKNSVIKKISMDHSNCSLAGHETEKESGDNTTKISIIDKKLFCETSENILDDVKKTEMVEDHTAVRSCETNSTNFLSKVRMWSSHFKKYSEDSTMVSQSSSVLASFNTDSMHKEIVDMEDSTKTTNDQNNHSYNSNLSNEDSLTIKTDEEDNIYDELNNTGTNIETASSTSSVAPVKVQRNSEEVSTAYETDPETGKLVLSRILQPITSTPIKLEQEDSDPKRCIENSLEESSTHSFYSVKENKDNQSINCEINTKQNLSISVIDESTMKSDSQYRNENVQSELSSHTSLLINNKRNQTETYEVLSSSGKHEETSKLEAINNQNSKLNDFTESSIEKHGEVLSGAAKPVLQRVNSNKFSSESIIENSETDSQRIFRKEKKWKVVKTITSHPISIANQVDQLATAKTKINPTEISIVSNIKNLRDFSVSETPGICSEQQNPNEAIHESSIRSNEHNTSKNKATLNLKRIDKTSADSHSSDIIYDTSSLTEDQKIRHNTKTCTAGLASAVEGESDLLASENLINENEQNVADDLIINQRLSAVSETIFNNNSKMDTEKKSFLNSSHDYLQNEDETNDLGLGMHQTLLKNKIKNQQASMSHVTYLIRNPQSPEGKGLQHTKSVNQPLEILPQLHNATKMELHTHNKEPNTDDILQSAPKIHPAKGENEVSADEHSNYLALDNYGSHFSIGVQNSHIEPPIMHRNNDEHKYFTRSSTYLSLKRKLGTINENDSGSDISLSQDESARKEMKTNLSSNIHSRVVRYSESPVTTDSSSIEMNLKRVNQDIRRKRAKLKKENPVRKSSTSSSDDEVIKPSLLKGKSVESSKLPVHKFTESNISIKNKFDLEEKVDGVDTRSQQSPGRGASDPKDGVSRSLSTLALSFENKARSDTVLKIPKEKEYNKLSDSSSSIIYSSPNPKIGQPVKTVTYYESKTHFDEIKKGHEEEESQYHSSKKNMSKKSHKSYSLYRKLDKENSNIPFKDAGTKNEYSTKNLKQFNPGNSDAILGNRKDENSEMKNSHQSIKKNRKSSVVRLLETSEASQISYPPEVKGLLRRTYFMGNN